MFCDQQIKRNFTISVENLIAKCFDDDNGNRKKNSDKTAKIGKKGKSFDISTNLSISCSTMIRLIIEVFNCKQNIRFRECFNRIYMHNADVYSEILQSFYIKCGDNSNEGNFYHVKLLKRFNNFVWC